MTDQTETDRLAAQYRARQEAQSESGAPRVPSGLTPEDAARIRAEETYRATLRDERQRESVQASRPSYWTGFVLNLLVVGLGNLVIGEVMWGIVWFVLAIVLAVSTGGLAIPFVWIGVLFHYRSLYVGKYGQ